MLHHSILRLVEVCDDVVVVIGPDASPPALPPGAPVTIARDAIEGQGPLAGVLAGLAGITNDLAIVVGGDMPELSTPVMLEMLAVVGQTSADAVALADEGRFRPLPIVVRPRRAREVAHAAIHDGERSLRGFLSRLRVAVIDEPTWHGLDPERRTLRDVDEPGDLAE